MNFLVSFWRQRNYRIATIVAVLALLWLLSGLLVSGNASDPERDASVTAAATGEGIRVRARRVDAQPYATRVLVNGHTEANRRVRLRAELDGAIIGLPVAEGRAVKKGEVICEIDPEDRPEQLDRARAALRKAELDYAGARRLQKKGLQSESAMAQQEVALANARADYRRTEVAVENLRIRAPFDGVVNSRAVELGDYIRLGEECATLLELNPILVVGEVSESQVGNLIPGGPASAQLQQGQLVQGSLRYISQQAHEITRAYRVEVAVDNGAGVLRGGLSGRLALPTGEIMAHRINSSLLTLDDRGDLGLRILDEENRVHFANVRLIGDGDAGVWVSGLPERVTLITVGQEYVTPGEIVEVELESQSDLPAPAERAAAPAATVVPVANKAETSSEGQVQ
ncbi:membrane fusion protein, multidrug efflux system [Microbulbifer donghaiensis]|uniref:Membrane fusion protein, multidrug efflux system n=1 Tax=Microbulbifer donghaiensis TaxID=494016 RepID=A0A1M5D580_9GAMM|nr:efflux RND transporter periplasmic adaptor subunit [Microbulbifer donghaiensis]SHF62243.1 membrane fusion protein, multidrug efflux system [Microbulbifer donghaiensis]